MKIDLHTHSTFSDGQYTPSQLVQLARENGIAMLSLTDHDTIDGCREALAAGKQYGVQVLTGVEFSAKSEEEMHILGYGIDIEHPALRNMCEQLKQLRDERNQKVFAYLARNGVSLAPAQVLQYAANGIVGRPHFARAMLEAGYVSNLREAFTRYLATPEFDEIERPKPEPQDIIAHIHDAGGVAVLAHPISLKQSEEQLEASIQKLTLSGLDGIECYYSTHPPDMTNLCLRLARNYGKLVTIGSDFHGESIKPDICLGSGIDCNLPEISDSAYQKLKEAMF